MYKGFGLCVLNVIVDSPPTLVRPKHKGTRLAVFIALLSYLKIDSPLLFATLSTDSSLPLSRFFFLTIVLTTFAKNSSISTSHLVNLFDFVQSSPRILGIPPSFTTLDFALLSSCLIRLRATVLRALLESFVLVTSDFPLPLSLAFDFRFPLPSSVSTESTRVTIASYTFRFHLAPVVWESSLDLSHSNSCFIFVSDLGFPS
ncbi:hypothetical protein EDB83DRAFT_2513075 [Lactarius deliciosus]|nr:hypothetical protein EDB83DRAFT_2513075 [Lactarius deliciosus]